MHVPNKQQWKTKRKNIPYIFWNGEKKTKAEHKREIISNSSRFLPVWPIRMKMNIEHDKEILLFSLPVCVLCVCQLPVAERANKHILKRDLFGAPFN